MEYRAPLYIFLFTFSSPSDLHLLSLSLMKELKRTEDENITQHALKAVHVNRGKFMYILHPYIFALLKPIYNKSYDLAKTWQFFL